LQRGQSCCCACREGAAGCCKFFGKAPPAASCACGENARRLCAAAPPRLSCAAALARASCDVHARADRHSGARSKAAAGVRHAAARKRNTNDAQTRRRDGRRSAGSSVCTHAMNVSAPAPACYTAEGATTGTSSAKVRSAAGGVRCRRARLRRGRAQKRWSVEGACASLAHSHPWGGGHAGGALSASDADALAAAMMRALHAGGRAGGRGRRTHAARRR
jgi:hypothetical protein